MPTAAPLRIDAPWLAAPARARVFAALAARGFAARAVGGAVRNALLGAPIGDVDVATVATPEDVIQAARAAGLKALPTGIAHGTVTIVVDGITTEVTTLRRDVETHGRHARVAFTDDWTADASRRDFTMNALYCDPDGRLHDPLGGYADLVARRVRFIGDAATRIREDYLRTLRFFRFNAQYGDGSLDAAGVAACVAERQGLAQLSGERVQQELRRLLLAPRADEMIEALFHHGLLVLVLGRAPRPAQVQRLLALERRLGVDGDAVLRLAALAVEVDEDAAHLQGRLKLSNADAERLLRLTGAARLHAAPSLRQARALLYRAGPRGFADTLRLAWARAGAPAEDAAWTAAWTLPHSWQAPAFPLGGKDALALGLAPGPELGDMLRALEAHWIDGDFALDAAALHALLAQRIAEARSPN